MKIENSDLITMIDLSVVIPCKDEEEYVSICLDSLLRQTTPNSQIEIIVVDNGSTDKTLEILMDYSSEIKAFCLPNVSISELRNYGVHKSNGEWIAFIDADVEVNANWFTNLAKTLYRLKRAGFDMANIITGSTYSIPKNPTWVERIWFTQLLARDRRNDSYINGGNLIVHRKLFEIIGGFNPAFKTGEDVKFCQDALIYGAKIVKDKSILVVHHGYPKDVKQFFKRERWHGLGMTRYFFRPWKSRDLSLSLYYLFLLIMFLFSLVFWKNIAIILIAFFLMAFSPPFILALRRYEGKAYNLFLLALLYFVYGWARVCSLIDVFLNSIVKKAELRH